MRIVTPATTEPIDLALARKQCRLDAEGSPPTHEDDDLLDIYISTAREYCESELGRIVAPTLVEISLDDFPADTSTTSSSGAILTGPGTIALESGPVLGISSVVYLDEDGIEQTLSDSLYTLDTTGQIALIRLNADEEWPATESVANAVTIQYTVGYSLVGDSPQDAPLPKSIKLAILLLVAHWHKNKESTAERMLNEIPMGVCTLLSPLKLRRGFA